MKRHQEAKSLSPSNKEFQQILQAPVRRCFREGRTSEVELDLGLGWGVDLKDTAEIQYTRGGGLWSSFPLQKYSVDLSPSPRAPAPSLPRESPGNRNRKETGHSVPVSHQAPDSLACSSPSPPPTRLPPCLSTSYPSPQTQAEGLRTKISLFAVEFHQLLVGYLGRRNPILGKRKLRCRGAALSQGHSAPYLPV